MDVVYQAEDSELGSFVALGANEVPRFLPCNGFFTVEVLSWRGLLTYYVLFFVHLESHRVIPCDAENRVFFLGDEIVGVPGRVGG